MRINKESLLLASQLFQNSTTAVIESSRVEWFINKFANAITVAPMSIEHHVEAYHGVIASRAVTTEQVLGNTAIHCFDKTPDNRWNCMISNGTHSTKFTAIAEGCPEIPKRKLVILVLGLIAIGAIVFPGAIILPLLTALGFGSTGVIAGSIAASIQGPAVLAGSLFALAQSYAMGGYAIMILNGYFQASALAGLAAAVYEGKDITMYACNLAIHDWFGRFVERFWSWVFGKVVAG